jgi:hypothetical protein
MLGASAGHLICLNFNLSNFRSRLILKMRTKYPDQRGGRMSE